MDATNFNKVTPAIFKFSITFILLIKLYVRLKF